MLAALLVAVVAAVFAGVAVAAAAGALRVTAGDGSHARARAAAEAGIDAGVHRLRWVLARPGETLSCRVENEAVADEAVADDPVADEAVADETVAVELELSDAIVAGPGPPDHFLRVTATARHGRATAVARSVVALVPTGLPLGVSVVEDADVRAPLGVSGSGVYVGGALRGREWVSFASPADPAPAGSAPPGDTVSPPDPVRGGRWPVAGVHAGAGIWAAGVEIHDLDPLPEAYAADTDPHTAEDASGEGAVAGPDAVVPADGPGGVVPADGPGGVVPAAWLELPDAVWLASARAHALTPGDALADGVLHLDELPPALPTGEPGAAEVAGFADPAAGYLVCVSATGLDGGLAIVGRRDPSWAPLTLVVEGDAVLGDAAAGAEGATAGAAGDPTVAFSGALVVTGHLEIAAPTKVAGHAACRRLVVAAFLSVAVAADWSGSPPLGSLEPLVIARD